jgi:hydrogenase-1 operon protein HyaF
MPSLDDIPIRIEPPASGAGGSGRSYGNALPILSEIRHALARLADGGEPTRIDLAALPFGPGDEERLMALLGEGEVTATVDALGPTHVRETRFPGVWIVDYANTDDQRVALHIEVAEVPQILCAQRADIADALTEVDRTIADATTAGEPNDRPDAPEPGPDTPND